MNHLAPREIEIAGLVAKSLSNKTIAFQLAISQETVHSLLTNSYRRLEISKLDHPRVALALWYIAYRSGMVGV